MNRKSGKPKIQTFKDEIEQIIFKIQTNLLSHPHCISEIRRIYSEMDHDDFMKIIISILMFFMQQPDRNTSSDIVLKFLCNFLSSYKDDENENPWRSVLNFVLSTEGANPYIRFRLCQLVNTLLVSLGNEASLEDAIYFKITSYMFDRLKNGSANVRAETIHSLERLQVPDDPNDIVTKYFIYHMEADPSAKVREAIISKIARNINTIPLIMERLRDVDERVRRHTFIEMMKGFPVKSLRIAQRLVLLENGLTDESKSIREIVSHLMLTEWLASYNENFISFLRALKLNGSDEQLRRYHKTVKIALRTLFKKTKLEKLIAVISSVEPGDSDESNEQLRSTQFNFVIPIEHITLEHSVFWMNLTEYLYTENLKDIDLVLPDLTTYCEYLTSYYTFISNTDNSLDEWLKLECEYIFTNLITNLKYFDYSDIVGKNNLMKVLCYILKNYDLNDYAIQLLIKNMEMIVPVTVDRLPMLKNIITDLYEPDIFEFLSDRPPIKEVLQCEINSNILLTISELKLNILDLTEQIANLSSSKEYVKAEEIMEKLHKSKMEYNKALLPFINCLSEAETKSICVTVRKITPEIVLKCLKIIFYMVASKEVTALTLSVSSLYSDFIRRYTVSNVISIRIWAVKCGAAFAILHEPFSQDMFLELHKQIFLSPSSQIFKILIQAIFQLVARYGLEHFESTTKRPGRLSAGNGVLDFSQDEDGDSVSGTSTLDEVNWLTLMSHILDTCTDTEITNTIIEGLCLLCVHAKCSYPNIITKLMIKYFDPATDSNANQMLGVFFKALIIRGKAFLLEAALLPTIIEILDADCESSLTQVIPENVIRFIIKATNSKYSPDNRNIHGCIAETFLEEIQKNICHRDQLALVLSSELVRLRLNDKSELKSQLLKLVDKILIDFKGGEKIKKNLINFQKLLNDEPTQTTIAVVSTNRSVDRNINSTTGVNSIEHLSEDDDEDEELPLINSPLFDSSLAQISINSKSKLPHPAINVIPNIIFTTADISIGLPVAASNINSLSQSFPKVKNPLQSNTLRGTVEDGKSRRRSRKSNEENSSSRRSIRRSTRSCSKPPTHFATHKMVTRSKSSMSKK